MNLKIKCDTPKEQVLVLRKFKKLVPECRWSEFLDGSNVFDYIPFVDFPIDCPQILLYLDGIQITQCPCSDYLESLTKYFTASDFLRDDWKMEDKSELLTKLKEIQDQGNELEKLIKKESL